MPRWRTPVWLGLLLVAAAAAAAAVRPARAGESDDGARSFEEDVAQAASKEGETELRTPAEADGPTRTQYKLDAIMHV